MDHLIDRPDCSKLVGTFNLFIPCCRHGASTKGRFFKPLFLFNFVGVAGFEPAISGSQNRRGRPGSSIHRCAPLPHGAFDGKISQRGLTLPTSTIVPFPTYYGQSRHNAPNHRGLGRYVGVQFARPAHGENTRIACNPVLFTIKTMPCFGTTRNYDAAAGGQRSNFSTVRAGKIIGELTT